MQIKYILQCIHPVLQNILPDTDLSVELPARNHCHLYLYNSQQFNISAHVIFLICNQGHIITLQSQPILLTTYSICFLSLKASVVHIKIPT